MATRRTKDAADRPYPWEPMLETSVFDAPWKKAAKRAVRTVVPSTPRETANELFLAALGGPLGAGASKVGRPALNAILKHLNPPFNPTRRRALGMLGGKDTLETMQKRDLLLGDVPKNVYKNLERDPFGPNVEGIINELGEPSGMLGRSLDRLSKVTSFVPRHTGYIQAAPTVGDPLGLRRIPLSPRPLLRGFKPEADLESSNEIFNRLQREWDVGDRLTETASGRWGILGDLIEHGNVLSRKIREEALEEAGGVIKEEVPGEATAAFIDNLLRRLGVRGKP